MAYLLAFLVVDLAIVVHEWGHFFAARRGGIPVDVFSIGMGPTLWSRRFGETAVRVGLFPLGGYVLPKVRSLDDWHAFPLGRRFVLALGGPLANIVLAFVCLAFVAASKDASGAMVVAARDLGHLSTQIAFGLLALFRGSADVSGIVGIVDIGGRFASDGIVSTARFAAILNLNLALFNLIPLPPLDGSKMLMLLLERIYQPLRRLEAPMMATGWVAMLALLAWATARDVLRISGAA